MLSGMLRRHFPGVLCVTVAQLMVGTLALAQHSQAEVEVLKKQFEELQRRDGETKRQLNELQRRLDALQAPPAPPAKAPADALDKAVQDLPQPQTPTRLAPAQLAVQRPGKPAVRLIDISVDVLAAAGGSTVGDEALQGLQGGGHDPRKNGFTLQNVELSFAGAVDPYVTGETHVVLFVDPLSGETTVELEEAFLTTQSLPFGLQVKAGFFFTEFGLINPTHPHAWDWLDLPIVNTRFFGPDGMRQAGARLGWLVPVPWAAELLVGAQNANGETMASFLANEEFFEERAVAGRPFVSRSVKRASDLLYLVRLDNFFPLSPTLSARLGGSAVFGPNASGPDGRTTIYGGDLKVRWRPTNHFRGWPFVVWQSELIQRDYRADQVETTDIEGNPLIFPRKTLHDWGLYTQLLYGFHYGWATGVRFEYARGSGASVQSRDHDPFRDTRYRISPILAWHPSEFMRVRLQYNYDRADHLRQGHAHSVWLGLEFLYGAHPAHKF